MKIFITYHDLNSKQIAENLKQGWICQHVSFSLIELNNSEFLENQVYDILCDIKSEWENFEFIGIISYSIISKFQKFSQQSVNINWDSIFHVLKKENPEITTLYNVKYCRFKNIYPISMLEGACFQHGLNFIETWYSLLKKMDFCDHDIFNRDINTFLCNWWILKPNIIKEYISFYKKAKDLMLTDNDLINKRKLNSYYSSGNLTENELINIFGQPYYTITPFIFERLPCFFCKIKKLETLNLTKFMLII